MPTPLPRFAAIIGAAGQGLRAGQPLPKQFALWRGKPVLRHSAEALIQAGADPLVVMIPQGAEDVARAALGNIPARLVVGGITRQDSMRLGLEALSDADPAWVLLHDAARPVIPLPVIERLLSALDTHPAAIPVLPVVDSLTHAASNIGSDVMAAPADRDALRRVQTPQAFAYPVILAAHRAWQGPTTAGDDAQVAQAHGMVVALVEGDETLHKLTFASDFSAEQPIVRSGTGFDVHRLEAGEDLWLCGVKIEHSHGLSGHSDADVAIHALVDALLGAIGAGDIGVHFPPSDQQWRGASSDQFLAHAAGLLEQAGYHIGNVDVTIICEEPRLGPHREAMRARLAEIVGTNISAISIKATTTERLGYTGRGEGIAAQAIATLIRS